MILLKLSCLTPRPTKLRLISKVCCWTRLVLCKELFFLEGLDSLKQRTWFPSLWPGIVTSLSTSGSCLTYAHWHFGTSPAFINVVHQKSTNDFQSRRTHISIMQSILQLKENLGQLFFGQFWKMPFKPTVSVSHHICMQSNVESPNDVGESWKN